MSLSSPRRASSRAGTAALLLVTGCALRSVEHDEASHALPAHHPRTFLRAIDEIERRGAALVARDPSGVADEAARDEFADIAAWLGELAADTELGRLEWQRVAAVQRRLAGFAADPAAGDLERALTELRAVAATLPPAGGPENHGEETP